MRALVEQLSSQLEQAQRRLRERLLGIVDEEYLWEPVHGCWNIRRRDQAVSPQPYGRGDWVFDNSEEEMSPPPVTTIGWRLMHLDDVIGAYHMFLWGDGGVSDNWFEVPATATAGVTLWERHAAAFLEALTADDDAALFRAVRIPWWPTEAPRSRVVANVAIEATHHGAEIGLLRDLYARRSSLTAQ